MCTTQCISFLDPKILHKSFLVQPKLDSDDLDPIKAWHNLAVGILFPVTGTLYAVREIVVGSAKIIPGQILRVSLLIGCCSNCTHFKNRMNELSLTSALKSYRKAASLLFRSGVGLLWIPIAVVKLFIELKAINDDLKQQKEILERKKRGLLLDLENQSKESIDLLEKTKQLKEKLIETVKTIPNLEKELVELDQQINQLKDQVETTPSSQVVCLEYKKKLTELIEEKDKVENLIDRIKSAALENALVIEDINQSSFEISQSLMHSKR